MMRFDTLEDAEKHYKMYARQKGFGVRYCFRKRSEASGELIRASLVCHRAGLKIKRKVDTQNPQPIAPERSRNTTERTNCPAHHGQAWCYHVAVTYILKRWTWLADEMLVDMSSQVPGKVHEMPEDSVILMKTTLMKNEFASLAKVGCRTADGRKIIGTHLKEMKRELAALAKEQKKEDQGLILLQFLDKLCECTIYVKVCCSTCSFCPNSWLQQPRPFFLWSAFRAKHYGARCYSSAFDPQIEGQSALLAAMSAPVMPNPAAPGVYSAQLGASTRQGHSTYVAPAEPNILGYGATATPAALGAYSARSALPAAACAPATQPMSRSATPGVYTAQAAPRSNNKGHSSRAAVFKTQNQCQNASMTVMSESASAANGSCYKHYFYPSWWLEQPAPFFACSCS
ncbi:hypothetical protein ZWY2020_027704 [Hordeum vulgare]|nr:hypothetical protein ZWY2020_027704 [Hordeum vulgare]